MKIKNILAILSLGMVSCVGLEQYPTTSYTDETFWTIEDNVRTALYLGYNQCWHQDYYFANNLLSDDVYGSRHSTNETSIVTGMANTRTAASRTNGTSATRNCVRSTRRSTPRIA